MRFLRSLLNWGTPQKCSLPITLRQTGVQALAIAHLIKHGKIDAWTIQQLGTTDARKMLTRFRRLGLIHPAECTHGFAWKANKSGSGRHKVHYWTGKRPHGWKGE